MVKHTRRKKKSLFELACEVPTDEEQAALLNALENSKQPLVTAILGAVLIEHELETLLRRRFHRQGEDTWADLISDRGPLGTFSQKITAGHAFGIYDKEMRGNLDIVRHIRNAFAHSKKLIDFSHELVRKELKKMAFSKSGTRELFARLEKTESPETVYSALCIELTVKLMHKHNVALRVKNSRLRKKVANEMALRYPFANALLPYLAPPLPGDKK
jgi:hypothetical protein